MTTGKSTAAVLLLAALVSPIALFWLLGARPAGNIAVAAAIAIAAGWALNVAWAWTTQKAAASAPSQGNTLRIAALFGWACPSVLVLLTWLAVHLLAPGGA